MTPITEKQRQWLWFVGLWAGGLAGAFLLALAVRWVVRIM
jgi:hypothetical protein